MSKKTRRTVALVVSGAMIISFISSLFFMF